MMGTTTNPSKIQLPEIADFEIKLWAKVPGKERVYVTLLRKCNGGQNWNGGLGRVDYLDLASMRWFEGNWAGAATREAYRKAWRASEAA